MKAPQLPPLPKVNTAEANKQIQQAAQVILAPLLLPLQLLKQMNKK